MARKIRIAFFAALSIFVICFIFSNSLPSIPESSATSTSLAAFLRPFLDPMGWIPEEVFHNLVRKLAHFVEFGALGVCLSGLTAQFDWWARLTRGLPILGSVLVAMTDESIQFFTGRGNSIKDMLLDSAGALCGVLFVAAVCWILGKYRKNQRGNANV